MFNDIKRIPTDVTLVSLLKNCSKEKDLCKGIQIHAEISKRNLLEKNLYIGNALVNMYAKCGTFGKAEDVFEELPVRNVITWTTLISGYVQNGHGGKALKWFECMQFEGYSPNQLTYVCILKACGNFRMLSKGQKIHADVVKEGYMESNIVIGTSVVDMYFKCSAFLQAQEVFDGLQVRNVVTWNVLIHGYIEHGHTIEALHSYELMQYEGLSPDEMTFLCVLRACGNIGEVEKGQGIHAKILSEKTYEKHIPITTTLVDMYAKCGVIAKVKEVFDGILLRNIVLWTALISAYAQHSHGEEALICYVQMQQEGFFPDSPCFACIMKACASIKALGKGKIIHIKIIEEGWLEKDAFIGNSLVYMYASCGSLGKAREVFNDLPLPNVVSWTSLMTGYADFGQGKESLKCFQQMQQEGICPDVITFVCILKECGRVSVVPESRKIHASLAGQNLINSDILVGTTLIDMYADFGMLSKAQEVFNELQGLNQASWNALIGGYARNGYNEEVINCFEYMQKAGLTSDVDICLCVLKACGNIGALEKGQQVHVEVVRESLEKSILVGSALVDMYAKCGTCVKAQKVFDQLHTRDVVTWNALILGYAESGKDEMVLSLFNKMIEEKMKPDAVSFNILLNSCNHSGLVHRGHFWFETMKTCYGIIPNVGHYTCMVDLLGRAGRFDEVIFVLKGMPVDADILLWHTVLAACRKWGNIELGRLAFEHALRLHENDAAIYVLISNVYASAIVE